MAYRIGACDLGKATASFAVAKVTGKGEITLLDLQTIAYNGKVLEAFKTWYGEQKIESCQGLAATGLYAQNLESLVMILPEDTCQEAPLEAPINSQGGEGGQEGQGGVNLH